MPISSDKEYEAAVRLLDRLFDNEDITAASITPSMVGGLPLEMEFTLETVQRLRAHIPDYVDFEGCKKHLVQYRFAMLAIAIKCMKFKDINDYQKSLAAYCIEKHMTAIMKDIDSKTGVVRALNESTSSQLMAGQNLSLSETQLQYECKRYMKNLCIQNAWIVDPITRHKLSIMNSTVNLKVVEGADKEDLLKKTEAMDKDVENQIMRQRLCGCAKNRGDDVGASETSTDTKEALQMLLPASEIKSQRQVVVLGAAASGKSCLLRKICVIGSQRSESSSSSDRGIVLVPILIALIDLARLMRDQDLQFGVDRKDDLLDAFLCHKYIYGSSCYRMLVAHRARGHLLVLFDGLDEAGEYRDHIERYCAHLAGDANQNSHSRIVVSSRFANFQEACFKEDFKLVQVIPLTMDMSVAIARKRLNGRRAAKEYVVKELQSRSEYREMASNPLMLSMLISILAQSAKAKVDGSSMITRSRLYDIALQTMLHRRESARQQKLKHHNSSSPRQGATMSSMSSQTKLQSRNFMS